MSSSSSPNSIKNPYNAKLRNKLISSSFSLGPTRKLLAISGLFLFLLFVFFSNPIYYNCSSLLLKTSRSATLDSNITDDSTNLNHILFSVVGSMNTWKSKRHYSQSWWRPNVTRGNVFFDKFPSNEFLPWSLSSPPFRVNEDIKKFAIYSKFKEPGQVRIFRTVLESFKQGEGDKNMRWFVMTDDDTIIFLDNLVKTLSKYDHRKYWYIGMNSESFIENYYFSYDMAYGGAGYALSYPLAALLAKKLDGCIQRYPYLQVSDKMLYFCLADMGFSITHEKGFHQIDLSGDASGYLSSHPQTPLLSLHHIDVIDPIYPGMDRPAAINHLMTAAKFDQSRLLQQTICYHRPMNWTFSMSWGYSAHIYEAIMARSYLKKPIRTFLPYDPTKRPIYMFNSRKGVLDKPCEAPHVLYFDSIQKVADSDMIVTTYLKKKKRNLPACSSSGNHSADSISKIRVFSSATIPLQAGGVECCDVHMLDSFVTEVIYRPCINGEVMA